MDMEVSAGPENLAITTKIIIREMMVGQERANQLQSVLANSGGSESVKDLVKEIIKSFSNTLSILNMKEGVDQVSVISRTQAHSRLDSPCLDARKSEEYSRARCRTTTITSPNKKGRRGCYARRTPLQTWKTDTPTLINDGQTWRKYGQKPILNANYLRDYFRCSYKYDQGCKATKHVQRIQENPPLYRTTYFGQHTCNKDLHKVPELILDCASPSDTSKFISFDNTNLINKQEQTILSSFSSINQEYKEEIVTCDVNQQDQLSSSDYFLSPDLAAAVESPGPMTLMLSSPSTVSDYEMMEFADFDLPDVFELFQC